VQQCIRQDNSVPIINYTFKNAHWTICFIAITVKEQVYHQVIPLCEHKMAKCVHFKCHQQENIRLVNVMIKILHITKKWRSKKW